MPKATATTADEISETLRTFIDRVVDAKLTKDMTKRGQEVADLLTERGADLGDRASDVWRDTRPLRRDAAKRMARASGDAAKWSDQTWRRALRPALKDLWSRRTLAIGAASAAVPAGRELIDTAAARLGRRQREERHWGAFFLGLLVGIAAGAVAALLTAPKRGSEMRRELSVRADEVRQEIATRAKDAEWVPIFQRDEVTNGHPPDAFADASEGVEDAVSEATAAPTEVIEDVVEEAETAADVVDEAYDTADRETT